MIALIPVRDGTLPAGADEACAEASGHALLIGSGTHAAADALTSLRHAILAEAGDYAPAAWATALASHFRSSEPPYVVSSPPAHPGGQPYNSLSAPTPTPGPSTGVVHTPGQLWITDKSPGQGLILPASPDGRDLAPRIAFALDIPLLAGAIEIHRTGARLARWGSKTMVDVEVDGPFVATLVPGVRTVERASENTREKLNWPEQDAQDAEVLEVLPPDPKTADLAEAPRILGAGAGLTKNNGKEAIELLEKVADALQASVGATRVVTDAGHASYQRQIGTTGVVVDPELYIAFGISGAAQHIGGLGAPKHVVSVNTDPSCPMTAMADLGIVTDATALLEELAKEITHE
ncbi:Electron transfer flavoprotein, alpha subunit [Amycolatopsis xylanica]|uniref:Electron transfer flavoprotein, alpha subunit n=1 Tax=Amycolatopsis xylanica TaxID=589385 RepID=A0A1H3A4L5_9PSEU|nr:mycofactocin-associated electron transfer flavoprotein alpha subunit [Amycolatopsis xylanica]SDX24144.1 Electron transfer flavoprotein, alpha subunit [Amycolatopsis xylanica]